jgi:predicted metal-binding membrane protein
MATSLQTALRRDRTIVLSGLVGVTVLAWIYMFYLAGNMGNTSSMGNMGMAMAAPHLETWKLVDFALAFVMWAVMMVAMMVPSASPMILMYSTLHRRQHNQENPMAAISMFLLGYLTSWAAFSLLATLAQWALHSAALLSPMMQTTSSVLGGVLLLTAGVFQWTPLKHACLSRCRTPLGFLMNEWRDGARGALMMGIQHGTFCVGCCWLLMALLFVAGVMNLLWVATIAAFVLIEKVSPAGKWVSLASGFVLTGAGVWIIIGAVA